MSVSKTAESPVLRPRLEENQPKQEPHSKKDQVDPEALLTSLKEKQRLFATLKREGLINQDRHLRIEAELLQTIQDLEKMLHEMEAA